MVFCGHLLFCRCKTAEGFSYPITPDGKRTHSVNAIDAGSEAPPDRPQDVVINSHILALGTCKRLSLGGVQNIFVSDSCK